MSLKKQIENFRAENEQEEKEKQIILNLIQIFPESILFRKNELAHMTSSGLVLNHRCDKMLMVHHNIYQTWSWTGGHADGDENLQRVAEKEVREETGIKHLELVFPGMISLDILTVQGHYKYGNYVAPHLHFSAAYVFFADEKEKLTRKEDENSAVQWIAVAELEQFSNEKHMIPIYKKIIERTKKKKM